MLLVTRLETLMAAPIDDAEPKARTVVLPRRLWKAVKVCAVDRETTMNKLIEQALCREFAQSLTPANGKRAKARPRKTDGASAV
jgi:hypothetical protein